jgi:hypothetical protein
MNLIDTRATGCWTPELIIVRWSTFYFSCSWKRGSSNKTSLYTILNFIKSVCTHTTSICSKHMTNPIWNCCCRFSRDKRVLLPLGQQEWTVHMAAGQMWHSSTIEWGVSSENIQSYLVLKDNRWERCTTSLMYNVTKFLEIMRAWLLSLMMDIV